MIETFLLVSICVFFACLLLFTILLFISRHKKIHNQKLIAEYTSIIDKVLLPVIFKNKPASDVIESKNYKTYAKNKTFQETLLKNIINLHIVYAGEYNLKLEEFYRKSGLANLSLAKLKSGEWSRKCEGIRELSQMNIQESFSNIHKCVLQKHTTLKLEALLGLIRLKGVEGLSILHNYKEPINDWVQLNILYEIENNDLRTVKNFSDFLQSKNESVVILGLRLIAKFNQIQNIDQIIEIQNSNASERIKNQAAKTLAKLPSLSIYSKAMS